MSSACWDPSGNLLLTSSNETKTFIIWNCFGKTLFKDTVFILILDYQRYYIHKLET